MKKKINFIIIILLCSIFAYSADSNGIWHLTQDIRPGTFGFDETIGDYSFISNVFIKNARLNVSTNVGRGIFASSSVDDGVAGISSANGSSAIYGWGKNGAYSGYFEGGDLMVDANLDVSGNIKFDSSTSCGKIATDVNGNILCETDEVDDADSVIGNEYPIVGTGILITNNREVNVDTSIIATKNYVDTSTTTTKTYIDNSIAVAKAYADSNDNVNDADAVIGNEYPLAGVGTYVTSGRYVNVDTSIIATKAYVDTQSSSVPCSWSGERGIYGNSGGSSCWDDVYITCTAGKVTNMRMGC